MKAFKHVIILIAMLFFQHCTKPVDFDQIDNANFDAAYLFTLIHTNLTAPDFLDELNDEISLINDVIDAKLSDDLDLILEKIEFTVTTKNTFNRSFTIRFDFLNELNTAIYTLNPTIIVPENSVELTTILEISQEDLNLIYNATYIGATITLIPSDDDSGLDKNEASELNIKSSMKWFVNYNES